MRGAGTGGLAGSPTSLSAERLEQAPTAELDVEKLRADVLRAVRKVCPGWLAEQAEDLAQVATVRVLDRHRATGGTVGFSAGYLYRTAYSVVIDEIRRRRRLREVPIDPDLPVESRGDDPHRQAARREVREAVSACLAGMAASRRRAVVLHLLGHTADEIGAILAWRRKQVENFVYRGLSDLRACLKAKGLQP
jgi:RNA polymerase sigma-70 factor (ECF subfamily)